MLSGLGLSLRSHWRQLTASKQKEDYLMFTEPIQINGLTLRNRIVMPPMATGKAQKVAPGEDLVEYYLEWAERF